jgi:hypothetical protein
VGIEIAEIKNVRPTAKGTEWWRASRNLRVSARHEKGETDDDDQQAKKTAHDYPYKTSRFKLGPVVPSYSTMVPDVTRVTWCCQGES